MMARFQGDAMHDVLNQALFYQSTGQYEHEEMVDAIAKKIHPFLFEHADRASEVSFFSAIEDGRSFITLADFLIKYADDREVFDGAMAVSAEN
jgi:hypothetical protein